MKKIHESPAFETIGLFQSILDNEGILTLVKNEHLGQTEGIVLGGDIYPELWVMDDNDYERALEILRPHYEARS